jgi:dipeptidyl aminopeptidase/acylaminoacyl peptidase
MKRFWIALGALAILSTAHAEPARYMTPPAPIGDIIDASPTPSVSISPTGDILAIIDRAGFPDIAEFAEPELRLAGLRINPRNNGPANGRTQWLRGLSLKPISGGPARTVNLPKGFRFTSPRWSPDGKHIAMMADAPSGLELWTVSVATATAKRLTGPILNAAFGAPYAWRPDSTGLMVLVVPADRAAAPSTTATPTGPAIQENMGRPAPVRTYQDLLKNTRDEALFAHYFTSQVALVSLDGKPVRRIGKPAIIAAADLSPDGRYILQRQLQRPFSYAVPASLFAARTIVTGLDGTLLHLVADLPVLDNIPTPFDATHEGPRAIQWRADADATLAWVEAQDGGDNKREAAIRDTVFTLEAPFTGTKASLIDLPHRLNTIAWGRSDAAIVYARWWQTRTETRYLVNPSTPGSNRQLLQRNYQDRYNDPGRPAQRTDARGRSVLQFTPDGNAVLVEGEGARREGQFPFLDRMELATGTASRLWQAQGPGYESIAGILDDGGTTLITSRQSPTDPPNFFLRKTAGGDPLPLTTFADPAPQIAGVTKKTLAYRRKDGVALSGTLYLPSGYDPARDGRLPVLMWAYPAEFTDPEVAGQVVDQASRFVRPNGTSHLFALTQGYAVFDDPKMPIVGAKGTEANDTYVEQLVMNAEAAVEAVVAEGVADRDRIAVGGHSYGAFMTANLLAHTDLFRAGIARSGAYNRTLTPFGFQAEQRTYWEAPETYTRMSPFTFADRIREPILMLHGENDANSGTFPIQSERFFAALKGHGATVRLAVLPLEDHGYRARESVLHTQWEMIRWLDTYVKPPRQTAQR